MAHFDNMVHNDMAQFEAIKLIGTDFAVEVNWHTICMDLSLALVR